MFRFLNQVPLHNARLEIVPERFCLLFINSLMLRFIALLLKNNYVNETARRQHAE